MRGPLAPPTLPVSRSRGEQFDDLVIDVVEHLEEHWAAELEGVEFAVEEVPPVAPGGPPYAVEDLGPDVVEDGDVPLARLVPAGADGRVSTAPARIIVYRRPLEARSMDRADLAELVLDVLVEQVARLLGIDPDTVDPPGWN